MGGPARTTRVVVIDSDARVRNALVALIDSTPGLRVVAAAPAKPEAVPAAAARADVVLVAVNDVDPERGIHVIGTLAPDVPVVAVSASGCHARRAMAAGALVFCDKDGDTDSLTAALQAAAADGNTRGSHD